MSEPVRIVYLRLPAKLADAAKRQAKREDKTLTAWMVDLLREKLG